jgi:hypothetical protein
MNKQTTYQQREGTIMQGQYITYYLQGIERIQSTTGKTSHTELGPYCVSILGGAYRAVSRREVLSYVMALSGETPTRIEREG